MYHPLLNQEAKRIISERRRKADLLRRAEQPCRERVHLFRIIRIKILIILQRWFDPMHDPRILSERLTPDC
jgi:hypothetical protein